MNIEHVCIQHGIKIDPVNRDDRWCHRMNVQLGKEIYGRWTRNGGARNFFSFAFVRNPWERTVSAWHNTAGTKISLPFEKYVRWIYFGDVPFFMRHT